MGSSLVMSDCSLINNNLLHMKWKPNFLTDRVPHLVHQVVNSSWRNDTVHSYQGTYRPQDRKNKHIRDQSIWDRQIKMLSRRRHTWCSHIHSLHIHWSGLQCHSLYSCMTHTQNQWSRASLEIYKRKYINKQCQLLKYKSIRSLTELTTEMTTHCHRNLAYTGNKTVQKICGVRKNNYSIYLLFHLASDYQKVDHCAKRSLGHQEGLRAPVKK